MFEYYDVYYASMDFDPHCGFRSCKNFKIESDRCYLHIGFEDSKCYDCDKRLSSVDYFCSSCAKIRMERYCRNCSKYSEFRHTEDTSITFGVRGGSARWAETTYAYLPPVCVTCGKNRNFHWTDDLVVPFVKITIFLSICSLLFAESASTGFFVFLGILFGFPIMAIAALEISDRYEKNKQTNPKPDATSVEAHRAGQFLSPGQKERAPRLFFRPKLSTHDLLSEMIVNKKQIEFRRNKPYSAFKEDIHQMKSICDHFGISLDFSPTAGHPQKRRFSMENLQSRVKGFNRMVKMDGISPEILLYTVNHDLYRLTVPELKEIVQDESLPNRMKKLHLFQVLYEQSNLEM